MASYIPPSVIVQGDRNTGATTDYMQPSTICIVGRMDKYPAKQTSRVLANGATATITAPNVLADTIELTAYDGTKLAKDTDYTQTVDDDKDTFSITITKTALKTQSILIQYQYVPDNFFEPLKWYTKASIADFYGEAFDEQHYIASPLTAAAQYAFDNGASTVCIVPVMDSKTLTTKKYPTQTLEQALEKLKLQDDIAIVVPVNMEPADLQTVREHITWCNTHACERRGIFGLDGVQHTYSTEDLMEVQRNLDSDAVLFTPNTIAPVYVSDARTTVNLPGWLYAAAIAGVAITLPLYRSLTRQNLAGFYGVQGYLVEERNILAQAGGCVIEMVNGNIRIRHSLTTFQNQQLDWSYRGVYNYIVRSMRDLFDPYIGQPSSRVVLAQIDSLADSFLEQLVERNMIYDYSDLEVARRNGNPSIVDVTFRYSYLAPMLWIYVNFSVDMDY